jgi:toxin-antitoxin system PIN domain toxin
VILADVNVLFHAFRADAPKHRIRKGWLESVVHGDARYGVSPLALSALVRVTTNRRAFLDPAPVAEAFAFCERLLREPNAVIVEPGARHWRLFERLCRDGGVVGPNVADAWCAALAIEHGCRFIAFDRDFARFPGLDWREPPSA